MAYTKEYLSEFNFTVLIDKSGSMHDMHNTILTRWQKAEEITKNVAEFADTCDDDGIDIITFGGKFNKETDVHMNVSADKVYEIFRNTRPSGATPLSEALDAAFQLHFLNKKRSFFVIITDGMPNDQRQVAQLIMDNSKKLENRSDLTILFLQVGTNSEATTFLNYLDNGLPSAKFDIVYTRKPDDYKDMNFEQLFYAAHHQ